MKKFLGLILFFITMLFTTNCVFAVAYSTQRPHWQTDVITVYIPNHAKAQDMKNAFDDWASKASGKLKFSYINDEEEKDDAQIEVIFSAMEQDRYSAYEIQQDGMAYTKAKIYINSELPQSKLLGIAMRQEVGHVLGLYNLPGLQGSIMHTPITEIQKINIFDIKNLYKANGWNYSTRRIDEKYESKKSRRK